MRTHQRRRSATPTHHSVHCLQQQLRKGVAKPFDCILVCRHQGIQAAVLPSQAFHVNEPELRRRCH
jgi:hypothetical protein